MNRDALKKAAAQHLQRLKPGCSVIIHGKTHWTDEGIRNAFESGAAWSDGNNFVEKVPQPASKCCFEVSFDISPADGFKKIGSYVGDGDTTHGVRHIHVPQRGIDLLLDTTKSHIIFYKSVAMLEFLCIELGKEKRALSVFQELVDFNERVIKYLLVPSNAYTGWRTTLSTSATCISPTTSKPTALSIIKACVESLTLTRRQPMKRKPSCRARQMSDQMHCPKCHLVWDMNDPDPPECRNTTGETSRPSSTAKDRPTTQPKIEDTTS